MGNQNHRNSQGSVLMLEMTLSCRSWRTTVNTRRCHVISHAVYHVAAIDLRHAGTTYTERGSGATFIDGVSGADDFVIVWRRHGRLPTTRQWSHHLGAPTNSRHSASSARTGLAYISFSSMPAVSAINYVCRLMSAVLHHRTCQQSPTDTPQ